MKNFPEARIVAQKVIERIDVDERKKKGSGSSFVKYLIEILYSLLPIPQTGTSPRQVPRRPDLVRFKFCQKQTPATGCSEDMLGLRPVSRW